MQARAPLPSARTQTSHTAPPSPAQPSSWEQREPVPDRPQPQLLSLLSLTAPHSPLHPPPPQHLPPTLPSPTSAPAPTSTPTPISSLATTSCPTPAPPAPRSLLCRPPPSFPGRRCRRPSPRREPRLPEDAGGPRGASSFVSAPPALAPLAPHSRPQPGEGEGAGSWRCSPGGGSQARPCLCRARSLFSAGDAHAPPAAAIARLCQGPGSQDPPRPRPTSASARTLRALAGRGAAAPPPHLRGPTRWQPPPTGRSRVKPLAGQD